MRLCGVVVLYNPSNEVLDNIESYRPFLSKLFVCDNSDKKTDVIKKIKQLDNIEIIEMNGNQGIGEALKQGLNKAVFEDFDFCLTMDQDSSFGNGVFEKFKEYLSKQDINDYGLIAVNYEKECDDEGITDVIWEITSGNFINLQNYKQIEGFNSDLFIDYVDANLCEQFNRIGKKIGRIKNLSLNHAIGNPIIHHLFGIKFTCMNHSPIRYYYRYRNSFYLYRKNKRFYKSIYKSEKHLQYWKMILFEPNKAEKKKMIKAGIRDAKKGILGKYKGD